MGFKKYIVGADGLPTDFAIGGLPLFSDDIKQLETNSSIFGITSILQGWSVILSGCLVDEIDTDSSICSVTPGLVLIKNVVYSFDGYTGVYPFSIKSGVETSDERIFKDGNLKSVATEYDYSIRTSFTTTANQPFPDDLSWDEIYFDPFSGQRAEIVLENLSKQYGETSIFQFSENSYQTATLINKTETNKIIIGASKPPRTIGGIMRWGNIGFEIEGDATNNIRFTNDLSQNGNIGGNSENKVLLGIDNIPQHTHSYLDTYKITDNTAGNTSTENGVNEPGLIDSYEFEKQRLTNKTNLTAGDFNLPSYPEQLNIENLYILKYTKIWKGYANTNTSTTRSFYNPANPPSVRYF